MKSPMKALNVPAVSDTWVPGEMMTSTYKTNITRDKNVSRSNLPASQVICNALPLNYLVQYGSMVVVCAFESMKTAGCNNICSEVVITSCKVAVQGTGGRLPSTLPLANFVKRRIIANNYMFKNKQQQLCL
jgi:hypothetical protein